jgi:hypothetical protein
MGISYESIKKLKRTQSFKTVMNKAFAKDSKIMFFMQPQPKIESF